MKLVATPRSPLAGKSEGVFQPLDFFMMRTPLLPVDLYKELFCQSDEREEMIKRLVRLAEEPVIREAIAVASPSLLQALSNLEREDQPRKQEQAVRGFLRYLIRMTTRPTPFGLFSGVTFGRLGDRAAMQLSGIHEHEKRSRPDMKWLLHVIRDLEANPQVVSQLTVRANPLLYRIGERVLLPYVTKYGQEQNKVEVLSVGFNEVVELTLTEAKCPLPYLELLDRIHSRYADTPREKISQFLWQLFEKEYLLSDLRPSMTNMSPLEELLGRLEKVRGIEETKERLQEIYEQLADYDALPLGEGEDLYLEILSKMRHFAEEKHLVQVDMGIAKRDVVLPYEVGEEAARAIEVLWRLSGPGTGRQHFESYREEFLVKYGREREVPLLELLDEEYGLGAPETYEKPASRRVEKGKSRYSSLRRSRLLQLISQTIRSSSLEIELTEELISLLEPCEPKQQEVPVSAEIFFSLVAATPEAVEAGEYRLVLGGNSGSQGAWKSFGRLGDLMGAEAAEWMQHVQQAEQAILPDRVFAEVTLLPQDGRAGNVVLSDHPRPYVITVGAGLPDDPEREIPVSDLVVGLHGDRFYLRSKSRDCLVMPTAMNLLNTVLAPNVYRFLRELAVEGQRSWHHFLWELDASPFLPRLRLGRAILSPAKWNVNALTKPFATLPFREALQQWRQEWNVPRHVYLTDLDNRLLLDLENPLHLAELEREFRNLRPDHGLTITETGWSLEEKTVSGEGGFYLNELVFPMIKARSEELAVKKEFRTLPSLPLQDRLHLPGGEWLYCKLYGPSGLQEELIGQHVGAFALEMEQAGLCDSSFFIRYRDPEPHVRLRFHGNPATLTGHLMPQIHRWAGPLLEAGLLTRVALDTYEQETERYGGPALIAAAEQMFAEDSKVAASWWQAKQDLDLEMETWQFAVVSCIDIMEKFGMTFDEQVRWFDRRIDPKQEREFFRRSRSVLLNFADPAMNWAGLRSQPQGMAVLEILDQRGAATSAYAQAVREALARGECWSDFDNILASVLHMHLNRTLGTDRKEESLVMAMVRHTLSALRQMRVNQT